MVELYIIGMNIMSVIKFTNIHWHTISLQYHQHKGNILKHYIESIVDICIALMLCFQWILDDFFRNWVYYPSHVDNFFVIIEDH
jgi:hypothetical protein